MKLNEKISSCRKKAGMSQVDLADALGVSRQSVSKWETGESNPEITKIPQMAKLFGVTADWLLSEEEKMPSAGDASSAPWPDWVENLPQFLGNAIKRYGWIYGLRMAVSGGIMAAIGFVARMMFKRMLLGFGSIGYLGGFPNAQWGTFSPMDSFQNSAWSMASLFTGFMIGLGLVIGIAGGVIAVLLKKWGSR